MFSTKDKVPVHIAVCLHLLFVSFSMVSYAEESDVPRLKFFYYDSSTVEWVVSSDKDAFAEHLKRNPESSRLVTTLREAVLGDEPIEAAKSNITGWIAERRAAFEQRHGDSISFRKAEGIVAYLRAHDHSIRNLTNELKRRSGASAVELVAIHQRPRSNKPDFKLKVVLRDAHVAVGPKDLNIDIASPNAGYAPVIYALGLALYEVQERISVDKPIEELPEPRLLTDQEPVAKKTRAEIEKVVYEFE